MKPQSQPGVSIEDDSLTELYEHPIESLAICTYLRLMILFYINLPQVLGNDVTMNEDSLNAIGLLLKLTTTLESLNLNGKQTGSLIPLLAQNRSLTSLYLGMHNVIIHAKMNNIALGGDDTTEISCQPIADMLTQNTCLSELLVHTSIIDGFEAIMNAFIDYQALTSLQLFNIHVCSNTVI